MLETVDVDAARVLKELRALAAFSDCPEPPPAVTRVVYTPTDLRAREYVCGLFDEAGLQTRVDALGNTFARWQGADPHAAPVATGSHCDAIPYAGMYDGTVGVLGGIEAVRALQRSGYRPRRPIEIVFFTSEEPTRFGVGCLGSRALAGALTPACLTALRDANGVGLDEARAGAGFTGELSTVRLAEGAYAAFVELHIEQGPELERDALDLGVVTAIAAPATVEVVVTGEGGHAGGVLMPDRRDALVAAACMITAIDDAARTSPSADLVATVGTLDIHPGAVNSIPSRVRFSLDLRDVDGANRDAVLDSLRATVDRVATGRGVRAEWRVLNSAPPAVCDPSVVAAVERSAQRLGLSARRMVSRAYHDSLFMARVAPMGMLFIPCRGGVSHRPDEFSTPEQIARGVQALALTLAELSG